MAGVTSVVDHHAGPEAIDGSLSVIRRAFEEIGLRGLLCYETTDRNGMDGARAGVQENLRFAREIDAERAAGGKPLVDGAIGAHAGFTVGEETLAALGDAVRSSKRGLHTHAGEDKFDAVDSRYRFGADLAVRLDAAGCLGPKTIIGHGVWLTEAEVELVNARGSFLAHNARSNMNNSVGSRHPAPLRQRGARDRRHERRHARGVPLRLLQAPRGGRPLVARGFPALPGPRQPADGALRRRGLRAGRRRRGRGSGALGTTIRRRLSSAATSRGTWLSACRPDR